jgi:hypothetical protein
MHSTREADVEAETVNQEISVALTTPVGETIRANQARIPREGYECSESNDVIS